MAQRIDGFSRVRAPLDVAAKTGSLTDELTGSPAVFGRGARVRFEFLLMAGSEIADPSLINSARLRILSSVSPDSALGVDKLGASFMNLGTSLEEWETHEPDKCHLAFELTSSEAAEGVFAGTLSDEGHVHWLIVTYGVGNDLLWAGRIQSFDTGNGAAGVPPTTGIAASLDQVRALLTAELASCVRFNGNPAGAYLEFTSAVGNRKVKLGADSNGELDVKTQPIN